MTERPEERDSRLAEIEKWHKPIWVHDHGANLCNIDRQHWPCDAEILLNEATSLRRRLEETSWELADERAGLRRAEAEVKELREQVEAVGDIQADLEEAATRQQQMEEALREIAFGEGTGDPGCTAIARAALSPSDTETRS